MISTFTEKIVFERCKGKMNINTLKRKLRRDNPRWVILLIDMFIVLSCYVISSFIIGGFKGNFNVELMIQKSFFVASVYGFLFLFFGTYKGIIRQAGIRDAMQVFRAVFLALILLSTFTFFIRHYVPKESTVADFLRMSYAVLFTHAFFTIVVMVAARIFYRTIYEAFFFTNRKRANALIFGASRPGLVALSLLREDIRIKHTVVAFIEDDPSRVGKRLGGLRVLDYKSITKSYVEQNLIERVIIAVENDDPERLRAVSDHLESLGLYIKIMPKANDLLSDGERRHIRALKIEDLLGRKTIQLHNPSLDVEMSGKVILVTGAAGSIGSELVRQISTRNFSKLILLDQAESALYDVQQGLKKKKKEFHFIVGNVRNRLFIKELFETHRPDLVFHAAAYKHVPLMESNPYEAILTNVAGTKNVADMAMQYGTKKFVMVSTDKAVNPTNVMGATKRAAEIYVTSCTQLSKTAFIVTRFGNVLGSNGSVIPLFERQIEAGGPLTLTDAEITRYFMTIPEACQLVQEAGVMGKGGEVFVFDMGKSVKIMDLAKRMIRLKGYRYPQDIDIVITGLRPGEKIFEELLANDENTIKTHHNKIMIAKVNQDHIEQKREILEHLFELVSKTEGTRVENMELVRILKQIVPEYLSQNSVYEQLDKEVVNNRL